MILDKQHNPNIDKTNNPKYCESMSKENIKLTFLSKPRIQKVCYIHVHIYEITYWEPS